LRFPGFEGEWEECCFSDIGMFFKGKGISKDQLSESGTPCILYGELYTKYRNEVINKVHSRTSIGTKGLIKSKFNDVIIPSSGESALDIARACCVNRDDILLGGDLNVIRPHKDNGNFISYQINGKRKQAIAKIAQGSSVVHLYNDSLKQIKMFIPKDINEQNKITNILNLINIRISTQIKIIENLQTLMIGLKEKLFTQQLRFKQYSGPNFSDWEEKKFREVCDVKRGASPRPISSQKWFDEKSNIGWVRISDVTKSNKYLKKTEQYLSPQGVSKSRLVREGNIIMSICATIGKPIYTNFDVCIHDGFVVFENLNLNKEFFYYYLNYIQLNWYKYGQPGTQINLNSEIVNNETISVPQIEEQTSIVNFLSSVDAKINAEKKILDKYKTQKKYLLQNLLK